MPGANTSADHLCVLDAVRRRARGGIAAAGADPSAIGSVIFPLREKFGDSSTRGQTGSHAWQSMHSSGSM